MTKELTEEVSSLKMSPAPVARVLSSRVVQQVPLQMFRSGERASTSVVLASKLLALILVKSGPTLSSSEGWTRRVAIDGRHSAVK
jgi:hypothetical protein